MEAPLIDQLNITNEEREITISKVKCLFNVHVKKTNNAMNTARFFEEWMAIAKRIKNGMTMLDKPPGDTEESRQHYDALYDLYVLQLKMLGLYEEWFRANLSNEDQFLRAYDKVYAALR